MKIYIVRHGETDLNAKGVMQGWLDEPLNESGRELAVITGRKMKGIKFDQCISSPLIRAKETAELILQESENDIPIHIDNRLIEINFGNLEGKYLLEMGKVGQTFFTDPFSFVGFPNGEKIQDVCNRTQEFLNELIKKDDQKIYLIATHGCALRAMLNLLYDNPFDYWHGHVPYNCCVNIVEAEKGKAWLIADDRIYYPVEFVVDRYAGEGEAN